MNPLFYVLYYVALNPLFQMKENVKTLDGEYLFNKMEMSAGFLFKKDGTFLFYFSYGASDRNAKGTYTIIGDTLKLNSDKEPGNDFTIDQQSKKSGPIEIHVKGPNKMLTSSAMCICFHKDERIDYEADQEGVIRPEVSKCDKIFLKHQYYPDIPTLIKDEGNENNYFEVTLKQSLQQVSFKGIDFVIKENTISCLPNYFMPFDHIVFTKSN